jgi:hypothetical protein
MKPFLHGMVSAKKFGGKPEDYQEIHDFIDSSKAHIADIRHRALLHSSFGIYLCEMVFGVNITNSDGDLVSVRDIAEEHVIEDLGRIPSVDNWLSNMTIQPWMGGKVKTRKRTVKASIFKEKENEQEVTRVKEP